MEVNESLQIIAEELKKLTAELKRINDNWEDGVELREEERIARMIHSSLEENSPF